MKIERLRRSVWDELWEAVKRDKKAAQALEILRKHKFDLDKGPIEPDTWSGLIVSAPFLSRRPARSWSPKRPYGLRLAIRFLLELATALDRRFPYIVEPLRDPARWSRARWRDRRAR
jgi:hypothetical protein